ncbi:hypothetical protein ABPG73_009957 [Tetrahymena malaccensis]
MAQNFTQLIDMFSQSFEFNLGKRRLKKGTFSGAFLSNFNLNESKENNSRSNIDEDDILYSVNIPSFATKSGENILKCGQFDTIKEDEVQNIDSQRLNDNKLIFQTQGYQKKNEYQKTILNQKKNQFCKQDEGQVKEDEKNNIKEKLRLLKGNPDKQKPQIQQPQTNFLLISQNCNQIKTNTLQKNMNNNLFLKKQFKCLNQIDKMLQSLSNRELNKKIQNVLFKFKIRKTTEYQSQQGLNSQTKKNIDQQIDRNTDFLMIYEDILFLKKAIMIILSKEQFATLKLVSCSDQFSPSGLSTGNARANCSVNYFEQQLAISLSQSQQQNYIKQFLINCRESNNLSEVDQRILSSIF